MKKGLVNLLCASVLATTLTGCVTASNPDYLHEKNNKTEIKENLRKYEPLIHLSSFIYLLTL